MGLAEIKQYLEKLDRDSSSDYLEGKEPIRRESGRTQPWNIRASDEKCYVVKEQGNLQEIEAARTTPGFPLKILTTELVCGRLGQLFDPPMCPPVVIVNISSELTSKCIVSPQDQPITPGPSFGSQVMYGVSDTKSRECTERDCIADIPINTAARLTTFHVWLNAMDPAALVSAHGSTVHSIDHGFFLTGPQWDEWALQGNVTSPIELISPQWKRGYWTDGSYFCEPINELMRLSEDRIVSQFANVPQEWGATHEFMAKIASYVLARRQLVASKVATLYR